MNKEHSMELEGSVPNTHGGEMKGHKLIQEVCSHTDVPNDLLNAELKFLIKKKNFNEEHLTLDQLRELLAEYLQDILLEAKKDLAV